MQINVLLMIVYNKIEDINVVIITRIHLKILMLMVEDLVDFI